MSEPVDELLRDAMERARRYQDHIGERSVIPSAAALGALSKFREPLPDKGSTASETLALLDEFGSPATVGTAGSRFFGFVIGGVLPAALAANWLAAAWDQNSALTVMSPLGALLEDLVVRWVLESLNFPAECGGALVTGATMANFCGMAAARHALLAHEGWNVEEQGMFGAPPINVIAGAEVHSSMRKAVAMAGLGSHRITEIPADSHGRMRVDRLGKVPPRSIVCVQAGNVNTGAFDAVGDICESAHEAGAWVHVDGAFGLWARASSTFDHLTTGLEKADSWGLDAHKWLNVNYDSGIFLTRHPANLYSAFASGGAYLKFGEGREPMQLSPEQSRRMRAVDIWAALKSLGRTGLSDLIDRTCSHARRFAAALGSAGFEILNEVVINQVLVRFRDDASTAALIDAIQQEGTCWCGGTIWQGRRAMRISVSSWRTTQADVDRSIEAILRCSRAL